MRADADAFGSSIEAAARRLGPAVATDRIGDALLRPSCTALHGYTITLTLTLTCIRIRIRIITVVTRTNVTTTTPTVGPTDKRNENRLKNAYGHFCGIDSEDRLLCWGRDLEINGESRDVLVPKVVGPGKSRWSQVGVGMNHICALNKDDSFVYCMGSGYNGQLGDGSPVDELATEGELTPIVGGKEFKYLTVGDNHACAISKTGSAFCWGSNEYGQLGNGDTESSSTPIEVFSDVDSWTTITAGAQHTCGTKNGLEGWCWGSNVYKEVNASPEERVLSPSKVAGSWKSVVAGDSYTLAIDTAGKGFGWGVNERIDVDFAYGGMLGDNSTTMCYDPRTQTLCSQADDIADILNSTVVSNTKTENMVPIAGDHVWSSISAGGRIPCGIELVTQRMLCWGYTLGEAYVDGSPQSLFPTPIGGAEANATWALASSGVAGSRCGIQTDGYGYCWGLNEFDCGDNCPLGDGKTDNSPVPVRVSGVDDWLRPGVDSNETEVATTVGIEIGVGGENAGDGGAEPPPVSSATASACFLAASMSLILFLF